jgi:hypothetical protein
MLAPEHLCSHHDQAISLEELDLLTTTDDEMMVVLLSIISIPRTIMILSLMALPIMMNLWLPSLHSLLFIASAPITLLI